MLVLVAAATCLLLSSTAEARQDSGTGSAEPVAAHDHRHDVDADAPSQHAGTERAAEPDERATGNDGPLPGDGRGAHRVDDEAQGRLDNDDVDHVAGTDREPRSKEQPGRPEDAPTSRDPGPDRAARSALQTAAGDAPSSAYASESIPFDNTVPSSAELGEFLFGQGSAVVGFESATRPDPSESAAPEGPGESVNVPAWAVAVAVCAQSVLIVAQRRWYSSGSSPSVDASPRSLALALVPGLRPSEVDALRAFGVETADALSRQDPEALSFWLSRPLEVIKEWRASAELVLIGLLPPNIPEPPAASATSVPTSTEPAPLTLESLRAAFASPPALNMRPAPG
jgi:hypothetical protein